MTKALPYIFRKGMKYLQARTTGNRETTTLLGCVNTSGNKLPPHVIVKGKTARSLQSLQTHQAPPGTTFTFSESGWIKQAGTIFRVNGRHWKLLIFHLTGYFLCQGIMYDWFKNHFLTKIGPERPQVLILDGHNSHNFVELVELAEKNKIVMVELPEHTSHWLQPLDR